MADIEWPDGLTPYRAAFYLQPHVGGTESPLTRTRKVYGLSKPRWVCRLSFRGGHKGYSGVAAYGPILDSLIVRMRGGENRVALWDFRRPYPVGLRRYYSQFAGGLYTFGLGETFELGEKFYIPAEVEPDNEAAAAGSSQMWFTGFEPGERAFNVGDYFGGDGRVHIMHNNSVADANGRAFVFFDPPLDQTIPAGRAVTMEPTSLFRLNGEDAGENTTEVDSATMYNLEFIEDLP